MAATASSPTKSEILSLFRSFIRVSRIFRDHNLRDYTKRRGFYAFGRYPDYNTGKYIKRCAVDAFRRNATLSEASSVSEAFSYGKRKLEEVQVQAVYSVLRSFQPPPPSPEFVCYEDLE